MDENLVTSGSEIQFSNESGMGRSIANFMIMALIRIQFSENLGIRAREEREAFTQLLRIGKQYASEMSDCSGNSIQLAATVMACSLLEMLLMLTCLCYKDRVVVCRAWRKNNKVKKNRTFLESLERTEICTLIEVAKELQWFSSEMPEEFTKAVESNDLVDLLETIPRNQIPSLVAAGLAKDARNRLHPGFCLRMDEDPSDPKLLLLGVGFMGLALASFIKSHDYENKSIRLETN